MCGLAGIASNTIDRIHVDQFKSLFFLSSLRGLDCSGHFSIYQKPEQKHLTYRVETSLLDAASYVLKNDPWTPAVDKGYIGKIIAGHSRSATVGDVTIANAHPFVTDQLIGMHNGTIKSLKKEGNKTDSQVFFELLSNNTMQELMDTKLEGGDAFALVWFDKKNSSLNFFRNSQRPLHFYRNKSMDIFAWASEKFALSHMLARHDVDFKAEQIHEFAEHKHFSFIPTKNDEGEMVYDFDAVKVEVISRPRFFSGVVTPIQEAARQARAETALESAHVYSTTNTTTGGGGRVNNPIWFPPYETTNFPNFPDMGCKGTMFKQEGPLSYMKYSIHGIRYTQYEIQKKLEEGCMWDNLPVHINNFLDVLWLSPHHYLCPTCAKNKDLVKAIINRKRAIRKAA